MSLLAPKPEQISFARQVAWERGRRLAVVPQTSSELSKVIDSLLKMDALPITEQQVEQIRQLNEQSIATIPDFTPVDEIPTDRAGANRLTFSMRRRLAAVKYHNTDVESFLAPAGAEAAPVNVETVVSDDDAPF